MRIIIIALLIGGLGFSAHAQDAAEGGRYSLVPVPGGALRLDTETGNVSLCKEAGGAVACRPVPAEGAASTQPAPAADRLAALEARIAALEARAGTDLSALPDEEAVDRVAELADRMMRRFFGMVQEFRRELEGEQQL